MTANADAGKDGFSTSTGPDGQEIPVVPPKEVESGVDYYMNIQAIQNLMGLMYALLHQVMNHKLIRVAPMFMTR